MKFATAFPERANRLSRIADKIDSSIIILNHRVVLQDTVLKAMQDQKITIKGRCLGYDNISKKIKFDHVKKIAGHCDRHLLLVVEILSQKQLEFT